MLLHCKSRERHLQLLSYKLGLMMHITKPFFTLFVCWESCCWRTLVVSGCLKSPWPLSVWHIPWEWHRDHTGGSDRWSPPDDQGSLPMLLVMIRAMILLQRSQKSWIWIVCELLEMAVWLAPQAEQRCNLAHGVTVPPRVVLPAPPATGSWAQPCGTEAATAG